MIDDLRLRAVTGLEFVASGPVASVLSIARVRRGVDSQTIGGSELGGRIPVSETDDLVMNRFRVSTVLSQDARPVPRLSEARAGCAQRRLDRSRGRRLNRRR